MYSPRIRDELIPQIYRVARQAGVAMTTWVNHALEQALREGRGAGDQIEANGHSHPENSNGGRSKREAI